MDTMDDNRMKEILAEIERDIQLDKQIKNSKQGEDIIKHDEQDEQDEIIKNMSDITGVEYSDEQIDILKHKGGMNILACAGSGKALKDGTGVLTPSGYVPIEKLKVGDICYDVDGREQTVLGVFPQGKKEVYEVKFIDGTVIECCKDHLWTYNISDVININDCHTTSTEAIKNILDKKDNKIYIPINKPIKFKEGKKNRLRIPPYLMGVLIRDRTLDSMVEYPTDNKHINHTKNRAKKELNGFGIKKINIELEKLGLGKGDIEHIPNIYKFASINNRLELLKGLIDISNGVDGDEIDDGEEIEFLLLLETLADDIKFIAESLGIPVVKKELEVDFMCAGLGTGACNGTGTSTGTNLGNDGKTKVYTIKFYRNSLNRIAGLKDGIYRGRCIDRIIKTGQYVNMTCIKVSGRSELFVAENCVVTHNTTTLTHLIAKRVITGEIENTDKLLCTTYSRAGAQEMENRLKKLFDKLDLKSEVTVKTLHAFYLMVLKNFGLNMRVIDGKTRFRFIREACAENRLRLEDEDLVLIDSLMSYQINNLMSDDTLIKSYVYTLDNVSRVQYTNIRMGYNKKKQEAGVMDFDDMQLYMYTLLVQQQREDVIAYCRNRWTDFYIDEAQDVSKIQFEIMRKLITENNKIVFIGDDDQCLVEGTLINTPRGRVKIEELKKGDQVLAGVGQGDTKYCKIDNISKREVSEDITIIKTESGKCIKGTDNHIGFARRDIDIDMDSSDDNWKMKLEHTLFNKDEKDNYDIHRSELKIDIKENSKKIESCRSTEAKEDTCKKCKQESKIVSRDIDLQNDIIRRITNNCSENNIRLKVIKRARLSDKTYNFIELGRMEVGMYVPSVKDGKVYDDRIVSIESEKYDGFVYDLSVPYVRNFAANDIIVHNCIYQWRGADPSIILDICGIYDIKRFTLTTNYRCYDKIVNQAYESIKNNTKRAEKKMKSYKEGGQIKLCDTAGGNLFKQAKFAFDHIKNLVINEGVLPSKIAVLSRNNQHQAILNNMLFREGIYCEVAKEMRFTSSSMYNDMKNILIVLGDGYNHNVTTNTLWRLCKFLGVQGSKIVGGFQNSSGLRLSDTLGYILKNFLYKPIDRECDFSIPETAKNKLEHYMGKLSNQTVDDMYMVYKLLNSNESEYNKLSGLMSLYLNSTDFMYKTRDRERTIEGMCSYTLDLVEKIGLSDVLAFFRTSEQFENGEMIIPGHKVCMCTIHGAKGREWEHVIIFADDNITLPSFEGIKRMIKNGVSFEDISASIDEERRLHYVAMTRAKKDLTIFTDKDNVGVFTLEALEVYTPNKGKSNAHIIKMAQNSGLYEGLVEKVNDTIFNGNSEYEYKVKESDTIEGS